MYVIACFFLESCNWEAYICTCERSKKERFAKGENHGLAGFCMWKKNMSFTMRYTNIVVGIYRTTVVDDLIGDDIHILVHKLMKQGCYTCFADFNGNEFILLTEEAYAVHTCMQ